jgi:hypothetical protein
MDHQTFDRLTRLVGTAASRRTALRALLAGVLVRATTRSTAAKPCSNDKHLCGDQCCPGKCFTDEVCEVCCTGPNIICHAKGGPVCCANKGDPCAFVRARGACPLDATPVGAANVSGGPCTLGITGTYRRR